MEERLEAFRALQAKRDEAGVDVLQSDADWRHKGWHGDRRHYRVRPSVRDDHERFAVQGVGIAGWLTILERNRTYRFVIPEDQATFGAWTNSDVYARYRLAALRAWDGERLVHDHMLR